MMKGGGIFFWIFFLAIITGLGAIFLYFVIPR
jgi:hypothetical protein